MPNPYVNAARKAAQLTDEELAPEIAKLCRLKEGEVDELFPERAEKDKLLVLLEIVNSATAYNEKIIRLKDNIGDFAGVVIKLVKLLA
jgi:hypothetical protein